MSERNTPEWNKDELDRVRASLLEDAGSQEEAEAFFDVLQQMKMWPAPKPTPQMTSDLIENLLTEMPKSESRLNVAIRSARQWWPLLLIGAQLRVVRREIWAASALVMVLGTLVTIGTYNPASSAMMPMVILAPVVAAVGVALLYDSEYEQMLEIEDTTPASARVLLLARLMLVFGYDLALTLVGSVLLAVFHAEVLLWPLVVSWLAPMAFLSALAFLLSIMFRDVVAGSAFALICWGLHVILRAVPDPTRLILALSLPVLAAPGSRPLLFMAAVLLIALALWLVGQNERRVGDTL